MLQMMDAPVVPALGTFSTSAAAELPRRVNARSSRR
jgi:hypothetical protein